MSLLALRFQDHHHCPLTNPLPPAAKPVSPIVPYDVKAEKAKQAKTLVELIDQANASVNKYCGVQDQMSATVYLDWLNKPDSVSPPESILKAKDEWNDGSVKPSKEGVYRVREFYGSSIHVSTTRFARFSVDGWTNSAPFVDRICPNDIADLKSHWMGTGRFQWAELESPAPQADADGWIPHDGGKCPVSKETVVEVKLRCGEEPGTAPASWYNFGKCSNRDREVAAYRVITE